MKVSENHATSRSLKRKRTREFEGVGGEINKNSKWKEMIRKSGHCPYVGSVVLCTENIVSSNMTCCWSLLSEWVKHVIYFGPSQLSQHSDSSTVLTGVEFPGGTKFLATAGFFL
jgi:hypothetical protein